VPAIVEIILSEDTLVGNIDGINDGTLVGKAVGNEVGTQVGVPAIGVGNGVGTIVGKLVTVIGCIDGALMVAEETLILRIRLLYVSAMYTLPETSNETPEG
jgi:hypothetical protein